MTEFRSNGAIGALMDEYEKAIIELQHTISSVSEEEVNINVDHKTNDKNCHSIHSVLNHVIRAGYWYVLEIRTSLGENIDLSETKECHSIIDFQNELSKMFRFNEKLFSDHPDLKLEEFDSDKKMTVKWGQQYDIEQLLEHAIVHILRHRRQIERFLTLLR